MPAQSEPYEAPAVTNFAEELEWRRTHAELTKKALAEVLGFADSYLGQVELCKNLPSQEFAEALDTYFTTEGLFGRLRKRIVETRHISTLPPGFTAYVKRENEARSVRNFELALVNGILQTEDYARAMIGAYSAGKSVDELVADRMKRKEILTRPNPVSAWFAVDEFALHRIIGSPAIMKAQFQHLLELSELENVMVTVIPKEIGYHVGLTGSFYVLGFEDGANAAYVESAGIGLLIEEPARVGEYLERYSSLQGHALPHGKASRNQIKQMMETL
ncbi:hypothetical protein GCM10022254_70290 [Actinomadura meridiana]|uniref:DUF5753 domain-containing protein n=1 Tax=Actinomadura meridiana TaxID=559626 RepID=A0ABP8CNT6_9ACTN